MNMKKPFTVMLSFLLVFCMLSGACGALAAGPGDTAEVSFSMLTNPGKAYMVKTVLEYDHEALELVPNDIFNRDSKVALFNEILTACFRIRKDARPDTYPVTIRVEEASDSKGNPVEVPTYSDAAVVVECPPAEVPVYYFDAATGELVKTETFTLGAGQTETIKAEAPEGYAVTGGQNMRVTVSEDGQAVPQSVIFWLATPAPAPAIMPAPMPGSASTVPQPVSNLRVSERDMTSITLTWDGVEYAGPYKVEVRESGTDTWELGKVAYGTKARLKLGLDKTYDIRVTSVSGPFYGQDAVLSGQKTAAGGESGGSFGMITGSEYTYMLTENGAAVIMGSNRNSGKVTIPAKIGIRPVISIYDDVFYNCSGLTSVTISDGVTGIGDRAFYGCSGLTSVTIPNSVTYIGRDAFSYCSGLSSVTIPEGVISIGDNAFYNCRGLTSVTIPDSVTEIGDNPWSRCYALETINISPDHPSFSMIDGALYSKADNRLIWVPSAKAGSFEIRKGTRIIGGCALDGCEGVTSVTIPDGVTFIGERAFAINGLKSLTIPDSVTYIGEYAISNCDSLTSVAIPGSVKYIGDLAFCGIDDLVSVTLQDSEIELGSNPWAYCYKLTTISISPDHPTLSVTADGLLYSKEDKRLVYVPHNTQGHLMIPQGIEIICGWAACDCDRLTSVTIPDSVTTISTGAFDCTGLTSVAIPDSVTTIGTGAFKSCTGLTSVTIPDSVTFIDWNAFSDCPSLVLTVAEGSYAEEYCASNGLSYRCAEGS